ncbi:MAG: co-chaperone GroES [Armatimonadetes bacterium]|jgi:chaperonin GroES|nr:co-chaperone GroES [Armatimonadota bacterium]
MKIRPLGDKVVVKASTAEERTAGGIVLPDAARERPQQGKVVAVGPGRVLENGSRAPMAVKEGDTVVYSKYGGNEIKLDGEELLILDQDSIYAVQED